VVQDGQDKAFKDVIEPLESVSLSIAPTTRASLADAGTPQEVGASLVGKSAAPGTKVELLSAVQRADAANVVYYAFEFTSTARGVTRHAITTLAVANGASRCCVLVLRRTRRCACFTACMLLRACRKALTAAASCCAASRALWPSPFRQGVHAHHGRQPAALGQDGGAAEDGERLVHAARLLS
jgi:hypothetical protein